MMVQFTQMVGSLMIAANKDGQDGSTLLAIVVFVEVLVVMILGGTGKTTQIESIPHRLKVPTAQKELDANPALLFYGSYSGVDGVQLAVRAPHERYVYPLHLTNCDPVVVVSSFLLHYGWRSCDRCNKIEVYVGNSFHGIGFLWSLNSLPLKNWLKTKRMGLGWGKARVTFSRSAE